MELVLRFINAGGGVLLFPSETNRCTQQFPTLAQKLGAILPLETVVETDPAKRGCLPRMCKAGGAVAHTTRVAANHPVTAGVRGLLYPTTPAYNGAMGGNIVVDSNWTTLVTGSRSSLSVPTNMSHCECRSPPAATSISRQSRCADTAVPSPWPPHPYQRPRNTSTPTLFAVRQFGAGRVALLNQWRQFSIGSGSRWLYDNIVMEDGLPGMPSDMAKMVRPYS